MLKRRTFLSTALAGAAAAPLLAPPAMAKTPGLGAELVAAINAGDAAGWIARVSEPGLRRRPLAAWSELFAEVREATGGLIHDRDVEAGAQRHVLVRPKSRAVTRSLTIVMDRFTPDKIWDVRTFAMPLPYEPPLVSAPVSRTVLREAIEQRVLTAVRRDDFSGAVRVVDPTGEILWQGAFGMADRDANEAATLEHRFHLGSADKSFTAMIVAQLIDEGRLGLDTKVIELLPDYPNAEAGGLMTVRHLLTHSAGLGGLWNRPAYDGAAPYRKVSDLLPAFAAEPLEYRPGEGAGYSNEGFVLLGALIEAVSGETWWDALAKRVYEPAGMRRSGHFLHGGDAPDLARAYRFADGDVLGLSVRERNLDGPGMGYRGNSCGGGYSTVEDMTGYLRALRGGVLASRELTELFTSDSELGISRYGMGFEHRPLHGRSLRGHSGGGPQSGINTDSAIVWETGWSYAVLGNYDAPFAEVIGQDIGAMLAAQEI